MDTEAKKIMTRATTALILDEPFFGHLALKLKQVEDETCASGWTNGETLGYNPEWIKGMSLDKVKGFIAHEVMHLASCHHARRQFRNIQGWNVAGDMVINSMLKEAGFSLPEDGVSHPNAKDKSTEEVYADLPETDGPWKDKLFNQDGDYKLDIGEDPGQCGSVRDAPGKDGMPPLPQELKQAEQDWKVAAAQAAQAAKTMGNLPGAIKRFIDEMLEPKIDWRDVLREFVEKSAKNDFTWKIPNRRYLSQDIYLPSLNSREIGTAVIAIDTSGSVSQKELEQFSSEVNSILEEYEDLTVQVIYCDTNITKVDEFNSADFPVKIEMHGGGGTDFRPPFEWVEKNLRETPTCMIYFTDLECSRFPEDPQYPTIWVHTKTYDTHGETKVPFGEVIGMDMRGDPGQRRNM